MSQKKLLYSLMDEHRAQFKPWAERWIANAMSTKPMDDEDRAAMAEAINGMYRAAKLDPPKRIVFVSSPFVLRFAGGFAAAIWHLRGATYAATRVATEAATEAATRAATEAATYEDSGHWWSGINIDSIIRLAARFGPIALLCQCARCSYRMSNPGNQWSSWVAFLSFFRHIARLDLPQYEDWKYYEAAAIHGGPRIMHKEFCMVSDRPEILLVDEQNRPHCETGPFCCWRDGSALYAVHGVRVPAWIIEQPEKITVSIIGREANAEIRRIMVDRYGPSRYLADSGATLVHKDDFGCLYRKAQADDEPLVMVKVVNSTRESDGSFKDYWLRVDPELKPLLSDGSKGKPQKLTARNAVASTFGLRGEEYQLSLQT